MFFHQRFVPGLAIASYLVGDDKTRRCAVIDPTRDVDDYVRIARENNLRITDILETHVHADFVSGARELKARLDGKPLIHSSGLGGEAWTPRYADHVVKDGDEVTLGGVRLRSLHTPGHTPEHISWLLFDDSRSSETPWLIFTGDFVFVGDVGRPDLLGEKERTKLAHQLYDSVFQRLAPLPDFLEIFPSHGAGSLCGKAIGSRRSSSLGFERNFNVSLRQQPEEKWTATLLNGMPPAPPYFARMKRINREGPPILGEKLPGMDPISVRELRDRNDVVILDTRSKEAFAAAHMPGAINIENSPQLPTWAGWVLDDQKPIVLCCTDLAEVNEVVIQLLRVGFDNLAGYLEGGVDAWEKAGYAISRLKTLSVQELRDQLDSEAAPLVLDVRTDSEWQSGHIESAKHIHSGMIAQHAAGLPRDREIAVICGTGYRSSIAASILLRLGWTNVSSVLGGMTAWGAMQTSVRPPTSTPARQGSA